MIQVKFGVIWGKCAPSFPLKLDEEDEVSFWAMEQLGTQDYLQDEAKQH